MLYYDRKDNIHSTMAHYLALNLHTIIEYSCLKFHKFICLLIELLLLQTVAMTNLYCNIYLVSFLDCFFLFLFVVAEKRVWWISVGTFVLLDLQILGVVNWC